MQALQTVQDHQVEQVPPEVNREQIIKYMDTFGLASELNDQEKNQFIEIAEAYQLNPFKREIYAVPYGEGSYRRLSIITGYEVYLKRAERTGYLDGWEARVEGSSEDDFKAVVEIHRKDWNHPFKHEVFWKEAAQRKRDGSLTSFWKKMPRFQLRKVCISQAFRLAFPDELGGIPFTSDELPEEMTTPIPTAPIPTSKTDQTESPIPKTTMKITKPTKADILIKRLSDHENLFTDNHSKWVQDQIKNNPTDENILKMESHINEVIKNKTVIMPLKRMTNTSKQKENVSNKKNTELIF